MFNRRGFFDRGLDAALTLVGVKVAKVIPKISNEYLDAFETTTIQWETDGHIEKNFKILPIGGHNVSQKSS